MRYFGGKARRECLSDTDTTHAEKRLMATFILRLVAQKNKTSTISPCFVCLDKEGQPPRLKLPHV